MYEPLEPIDDAPVPLRASNLVVTADAPADLPAEPAVAPVPRVQRCGPWYFIADGTRCGPTARTEADAWAAWGSPPPSQAQVTPGVLEIAPVVQADPAALAPVQEPSYTVEHYPKYGMWMLHCSDGSATWRRSEAAARALIPPAGPGAAYNPADCILQDTVAYSVPRGVFSPKDQHIFSRRPDSEGWALCEVPVEAPALDQIGLLDQADEQPLVRSLPLDPQARAKYFSLRGKAKKVTSEKQRFYLNRQADALMVWVPAAEALAAQAESSPLRRSEKSKCDGELADVAQLCVIN